MNYGQGCNEGFSEIYRASEYFSPPPPPPPLFGWLKKIFYFISFYLTISITYRNNLPYILLSIFRFSPTNPSISNSFFVVSFAAERTTWFHPWNNGISAVVSIFIRSWIGVSRTDKVSSLNKFERVFAQRHSCMKATYRHYAKIFLKRRIMYSYGHPGSFNSVITTNKEAHMIYANMNNETGSSQAAGFHKKTSRKFLPHQPVVSVKCN